ncbi:hypothetical protein [Atopobium sp. oral taxon 810]|nr:hypothetical protein [Atopobium sp. oral taxon 810]
MSEAMWVATIGGSRMVNYQHESASGTMQATAAHSHGPFST